MSVLPGPAAVDAGVTDEALLRRVASRDAGAFLALYDRYAPRLLGLIVRIVADRDAANDVLQEVMTELWERSAAGFDPALGPAAPWLLRLAHSRAVDYVRKSQRRRALATDAACAEFLAGVRGGAPDPAGRDLAALRRGLDGLTEEERVPLVLAFAHGMSREQIADQLGTPVGTIKTRIRRGVQRLAEFMTP